MAPVNSNGNYRPTAALQPIRKSMPMKNATAGNSDYGVGGGGRSSGVGSASRVDANAAESVASQTFAPRVAPEKDTITVAYSLVLRMMMQLRNEGKLAKNLNLTGNFHDAAEDGPTEFLDFEEGQLAAACIAVSPQGFWTTQSAQPRPAKVTRRSGSQKETEERQKKRKQPMNKVKALPPGSVTIH